MVVAGIDIGAESVKVVILNDGSVLAQSKTMVGLKQKEAIERAWDEALRKADCSRDDVQRVLATGSGKEKVDIADEQVSELVADAKGAIHLCPSGKTVIDVGAEEGRGLRCDDEGAITDYVTNEKCAAGSGVFIETMSRALQLSLEDFGKLSLQSQNRVAMNAQCAVFAESEVVSLIHAKTPKADIARSVHDAIVGRITSTVRRIGIEKDVVLIGGVAYNPGFVDSLQRDLELDVVVPEHPEYVGALGAALLASS